MSSVNKVILVGNLGADPEIRSFENGNSIATFPVATSEKWTDKNSGEKKTKTDWHNIVANNESLVNVCKNYLKKGSKIYLEGKLRNRKWQDQNGNDRYTTEVVIGGYQSQLVLLDKREGGDNRGYEEEYAFDDRPQPSHDLEDEMPF